MSVSHKYRPDIDGLRAVAVLPVLFFHANLGFPGGYVGVDIFFVISGFLITSLILEDMREGTFSVAGFWERRIRRIVPALTVVVLATVIGGWFIFWPDNFKSFGNSLMWQAMLLSNMFFWRMQDYFNPGGDTMPLLHTWSLAVEEQFYVLFPLLLLFLFRSKRLSINWMITLLCLGSFALSVAGAYWARQTAYYVLPTRACELMVGALLASARFRPLPNAGLNELAGFLGLGFIGWSVFYYSATTRFPGFAAALPCVGVALVIYSSTGRLSLTGRLLAAKPLVLVGLISYSLYLWHWPLLSFAKYLSTAPLTGAQAGGVLAVSGVCAVLTWKFVENPFRKRQLLSSRRPVFAFAGCCQLALLLIGSVIFFDNGVPSRLPPKAAYYYNFRTDFAFRNEIPIEMAKAGAFAELGSQSNREPVEILLWGDSHAMAMAPVLDALCRRYSVRGMEATHSMTAPILGYSQHGWFSMATARSFAEAVIHFVAQNHVKIVIIAGCWDVYDPPNEVAAKLAATIQAVRAAGARVYVLRDVPHPDFNVPRAAARAAYKNEDPAALHVPLEKYTHDDGHYEILFQAAQQAGATVLNPAPYLLDPRGYYDVIRDDNLLYWDENHLTVEGSMLMTPLFEPLFQNELKPRPVQNLSAK